MKTYIATGHAFVPVKVSIEVKATSRTLAILAANKALADNRPYIKGEARLNLKDFIVGNSEDEGAAWGFDANDAEEKQVESKPMTVGRSDTQFLRDFKYVIALKDIRNNGCVLKKGQKARIVCRYAYAVQIIKVGGKREMSTNALEEIEGATL